MNSTLIAGLAAPVLWFTVRRNSVDGRACRDYEIADVTGSVLLAARAFVWGRDVTLRQPGATPMLLLRRSRLFAVNGRVAVLELPSRLQIGVVRRNGAYYDSAGRMLGRFRDARSGRAHTGEALVQAAGDALLGLDGNAVMSGPTAFVLEGGGDAAGTLVSTPLPFAETTAPMEPPRVLQFLGRLLPARLRVALRSASAPRGWRLQRRTPAAGDPRLHAAAALFAIELSHW